MNISDELDAILKDRFTIEGEVAGKVKRYFCGSYASAYVEEEEAGWAFPVGDAKYPPSQWYAATQHSLDGKLNDGGYKHSGYDLNLDVSPYGDIERMLGLAVYAVADGDVVFETDDWSGVPMLVIRVAHAGSWLWVRYGHIVPCVRVGDRVKAGQALGTFANWRTGDHLHFDMCSQPITEEWLTGGVWLDPKLVLELHLDPSTVGEMLRKDN